MMNALINIIVPQGQLSNMKLDKKSIYMPILISGKPIGFIRDVNDKVVTIALWTRDWSFAFNMKDKSLLSIDLNHSNQDKYFESLENLYNMYMRDDLDEYDEDDQGEDDFDGFWEE